MELCTEGEEFDAVSYSGRRSYQGRQLSDDVCEARSHESDSRESFNEDKLELESF
jgi:hypothetical protein